MSVSHHQAIAAYARRDDNRWPWTELADRRCVCVVWLGETSGESFRHQAWKWAARHGYSVESRTLGDYALIKFAARVE